MNPNFTRRFTRTWTRVQGRRVQLWKVAATSDWSKKRQNLRLSTSRVPSVQRQAKDEQTISQTAAQQISPCSSPSLIVRATQTRLRVFAAGVRFHTPRPPRDHIAVYESLRQRRGFQNGQANSIHRPCLRNCLSAPWGACGWYWDINYSDTWEWKV